MRTARLPATELVRLLRAREVSPRDVLGDVLATIEAVDPKVGAYCLVRAEDALEEAQAAERRAAEPGAGLGPLHGVPYSLKDLTPTAGIRTTFGSKIFRDHVPDEDAVVAERLRDAGGVLVGKTNTPELGCKGVTDNLVFGATRNPWDLSLTPGGSSGGAAAAVATGMAPLAEGSDFAGSVRIPAAHCGVVGFKPSDGRIPIYPEPMPFHPVAFNHGPLARTVSDVALMMDAMAGPDPRDPRSLPESGAGYLEALSEQTSMRGVRVAWVGGMGLVPVDGDVMATCLSAMRAMEDLGCVVEQVPLDLTPAEEGYNLHNASRRAAQFHEYYRDRRQDLDPHLVRRIEYALERSAVDTARAEMVQGEVYHRVRRLFDDYDLLALPTVPCTAFPLGINAPPSVGGEPVEPIRLVALTYVFNMTGHPAISVPAGWTDEGLPVGLQLVGPWRGDIDVLRAAAAFEEARPWTHRWPAVATEATS